MSQPAEALSAQPRATRIGSLRKALHLCCLLGLLMAGRDLEAQVGPRPVPPGQGGLDRRLPEIELPDLLLELDGKPLMEGTYVRVELVGAEETTRIEGRIGKAGRLPMGKTRNLGLLRGCELRITANFLPLRPGEKKLIPNPVGPEKKRPKFPNWFQCIRPLTLETSPVHCALERMEPYLLGMGQLLDAHGKPMPDVDVSALSSSSPDVDKDTIVDVTDAKGRASRLWLRHYLPVTILGGAETDALGRFVIWSTKPVGGFTVHFQKKGFMHWAGFRASADLDRLRFEVAPTRKLLYELVLPSDMPMEAVGLRLRTRHYSDILSIMSPRLTQLRRVGAKTWWRVNFDGIPVGSYNLQLYTKPDFDQIRVSQPTKITRRHVDYPGGSPRLDWSAPLRHSPIQICDIDGQPLQGSWVSLQAHDKRAITIYSQRTDEDGRANPVLLNKGETLLIWSHDHRFRRIRSRKSDQRILLEGVRATQFRIPASLAKPRPDLRLEILLQVPPGSGVPLPPERVRGWWRATANAVGLASIKMGWQGTTHVYAILTNTATRKHWLVPAQSFFDYVNLDDRDKPVSLRFEPKAWQRALDKLGIH